MDQDQALLRAMQAGDEAALATLYDHYGGLVFTLALRIVGDRELAQEVLQDTFLRCWHSAERYDASRGRVASWLMAVARNRAIDLLRGRQHQARLREAVPLPDTGGYTAAPEPDIGEMVALRQTLTAALDTLPPQHRQLVELAYYDGMTRVEIAERLGEPVGTIKSRMRSAMERLRGALAPMTASEQGEWTRRG